MVRVRRVNPLLPWSFLSMKARSLERHENLLERPDGSGTGCQSFGV
jgi:hypothetical protein